MLDGQIISLHDPSGLTYKIIIYIFLHTDMWVLRTFTLQPPEDLPHKSEETVTSIQVLSAPERHLSTIISHDPSRE